MLDTVTNLLDKSPCITFISYYEFYKFNGFV